MEHVTTKQQPIAKHILAVTQSSVIYVQEAKSLNRYLRCDRLFVLFHVFKDDVFGVAHIDRRDFFFTL